MPTLTGKYQTVVIIRDMRFFGFRQGFIKGVRVYAASVPILLLQLDAQGACAFGVLSDHQVNRAIC
ncbi:hypothetical protein BMS3Bbin04_01005 [bacterium BMS3Bbin04]|nr:hypothetical protein BMS3Bbin04_01005 [bacterium BMS3Bbin04]